MLVAAFVGWLVWVFLGLILLVLDFCLFCVLVFCFGYFVVCLDIVVICLFACDVRFGLVNWLQFVVDCWFLPAFDCVICV